MDIPPKHKRFFTHAEQVSFMSDFERVKIGCIAVYRNRIIAIGYNSNYTSPMQAKYSHLRGFDPKEYLPLIHAEVQCLNKLKYKDIDFSKVELYIARRNKNSQLAIAKPCEACEAIIKDFGIKKVYYTINNNYSI